MQRLISNPQESGKEPCTQMTVRNKLYSAAAAKVVGQCQRRMDFSALESTHK